MTKRTTKLTQYDHCLYAARICISVGAAPKSDREFLDAAHGLASGLFGPAFKSVSYGQTSEWIDMCERALREAAGAPMRG